MNEAREGFMSGPYWRDELPSGVVVSPGFGLRQKQKLRPIDNLSFSGINSTVGLPEKLRVDTIEECAAAIKRWLQLDGKNCKLLERHMTFGKPTDSSVSRRTNWAMHGLVCGRLPSRSPCSSGWNLCRLELQLR